MASICRTKHGEKWERPSDCKSLKTCGVYNPFASCDTILALWTIHLNSKQDAMKSMTLSAICRLVRYDPILGQHFVERVGLQPVVSLLSSSHSKFQQPVVTIFNVMLVDNVAVRKLLMDRDFLSHAVLLLEHPSCLLRGKAYLTVALSAKHSSETLLSCCHARLISCIDRDIRRQASQSKSLDDSLLYLIHCLDYLIATVLKLIPQITDGIVESLSTIAGRKHPSAAQSKLLRANLPLLPVLGYFASSSAFTSNMMTVSFLRSLGILLSHAAHIDCGDAGLGSNAGLSVVDFCDGVFDVVHASLSSPHVIVDHTEIVLMHLLPSVALFLRERHVETRRMLSVGLLSDALQRVVTEVDRQVYFSGLQAFVGDCLLSCLPALIEPSGSMRLSIIQLLAVLVEADSGVQSQVAEDVGAIHSLMSIIPDCFNNLQDPTFSALMTLTRCLSSSSCLDRNILLSAGFLRHLATSLDQLTSILFDQLQPSPRGAQLQQQQHLVMTSLMPTLECLSSQLEYLLVVQQQLEQVVDKSGFEKLISAHSELLLCMPNLFQLISVEDTLQSAARCLLAMLQLYSQQFGQQFGADEMKHVLSALESHSCDQSVVLNIVTGLVTYQILQSGARIQADGLKQLKRSVMKLQKRTNEKHIKNLTADVLQRLS